MTTLTGGVVHILAGHLELHRLCDELESLADHLPAARAGEIERVTSQLDNLATYHSNERRALDAVLLATESAELWASFRSRITEQHDEAENLSLDIVDALSCRDPIGSIRDANAAGYMLRCLFEGLRRTILIEELILFWLARNRLGEPVRDALVNCLQASEGSDQSWLPTHL